MFDLPWQAFTTASVWRSPISTQFAPTKAELLATYYPHRLLENAQAKRLRKQVPLLVGNIGPDTFGRDDNALLLVDAQGATELPRASKLSLARRLVREIADRMAP